MATAQTNANVPCRATTRSGSPCGMRRLRGGRFCFIHSPSTAAKRQTARQRGGLNSRVANAKRPVPMNEASDVRAIVAQAVADALQHQNTLRRATVVLRGAEVALKVLDALDVQERLTALQLRLDALERMQG